MTAAQIMLLIDRYLGGHFFDTQAGGSAVIWMHFFWIFGHPEVYILVLPAFAIHLRGDPGVLAQADFWLLSMVAATLAIGFISLGVWAHHMFTDRDDLLRQCILRGVHAGDRSPYGDKNIQLAGNNVGR